MNTIHSVKTIGPVRLELLTDGRYMLHIEEPVKAEIDLLQLAHQVAARINRQERALAEVPPPAEKPAAPQ